MDSSIRGKGSIGGASLPLVASVIEEAHESPSGDVGWMPPYGYLHIVNLSRVVVVSVNSEPTDECGIAEYVVRTGCMSGDSSKLSVDDDWAAEACWTGITIGTEACLYGECIGPWARIVVCDAGATIWLSGDAATSTLLSGTIELDS